METLRAVVVGTGHLGRHHARILAGLEGVELVAVVDPDRGRGERVAEDTGARWLPDLDALEGRVDLAALAAPTSLHLALGRALIERGAACLVEKPLAASASEARALVDCARAAAGPVLVGHIERFNPVLDHLPRPLRPKAVVARRLSPYTGRSTDVSVVHDLMVHDLDLVFSWFGDEVEEMRVDGGVVHGPRLDWATCRLAFAHGGAAVLHASRVAPVGERTATLYDERCALDIDFRTRRLVRVDGGGGGEWQGDGDAEPLRRELEHLVRCARGLESPKVSVAEGLRVVEWADRIERAVT